MLIRSRKKSTVQFQQKPSSWGQGIQNRSILKALGVRRRKQGKQTYSKYLTGGGKKHLSGKDNTRAEYLSGRKIASSPIIAFL